MFIDTKFLFRTNISIDGYQCKTDATACLSKKGATAIGKQKMAFKEQSVTVAEFLGCALSGHAFCNLFEFDPSKEYWFQDKSGQWHKESPVYKSGPNKGGMKLCMKSDKFFKGSQTVFVDVDYTRFIDILQYTQSLTYEPTCVYMSFSDNKDKHGKISRRFRMVYVFDKVLDKKELIHISQTINDQIVFDTSEPMEDDCGTRISQYMNGVYGNMECYSSGKIYQVSDFPEEQPEPLCVPDESCEPNRQQGVIFDERLLEDMGKLSYADFMHFYSWKFKYKYRIEKTDWIDNLYQETDENYLQLWWYRDKQVDGQRRRRKLYKNACLRRLMFPDMDPNESLFNLYVDFVRFFDNSDHAITLETLVSKVKHAYEKTPEQLTAYCAFEINYWRQNRKSFIVKPGNKVDRGDLMRIKKHINWRKLDATYDNSISVQENIDRGINASLATLYRYCTDRGINPNPMKITSESQRRNNKRIEKSEQIALFKQLYDPKLTVRDNQSNLASHGLELSIGTISMWTKQYVQREDQICKPLDIYFKPPKFDFNGLKIVEKEPLPTPTRNNLVNIDNSWWLPKIDWIY